MADTKLITNRGELWIANRIIDGMTNAAGNTYSLSVRLLKAGTGTYTPADAMNMNSATIATADFSGYTADQTIASNTISVSTVNNKAEIVLGTVNWTRSSGATSNTIIGYMIFITGESQAQPALIYVKFETPEEMAVEGKILSLPLKLNLFNP